MRKNIEAVQRWMWRAFALLLLLAIIIGAYEQDWFVLSVAVLAFVIIVTPVILEKALDIDFPTEIEIALLLFIYASLYLGEINYFYTKFWWWDLVLHAVSGFMVAFLGFIIAYLLNTQKRISLHLSPLFLAIFSFSLAQTMGVFWEIGEFSMDTAFGLNMQKSGLLDTMGDLIANTVGALIVSSYGYWYLRTGKRPLAQLRKWLNQ